MGKRKWLKSSKRQGPNCDDNALTVPMFRFNKVVTGKEVAVEFNNRDVSTGLSKDTQRMLQSKFRP